MITFAVRAALTASLLLLPRGTNAQSITAPVPRAPLTSLVSPDDYPQQALAANAQGTVRFRLDVGTDGRVSGCTILRSSSASILDASTCRLMRSRARFEPARDARGRPVAGSYEDNFVWTLNNGRAAPPRLNALTSIWFACAAGESAKRALSPLPEDAILDAASLACANVEAQLLAEMARANLPAMVPADAMVRLNQQFRARMILQLREFRKMLSVDAPKG